MELEEIRRRLTAVEASVKRLGVEVGETLLNPDREPSATCIQAGVVIEQMLRDLWRRLKLKGQPDQRQFDDLLTGTTRKLAEDAEPMPVAILTDIRDIQLRRNQAAHHWNVKRHVAVSILGSLADVMTWYFDDYLPPRAVSSSQEGRRVEQASGPEESSGVHQVIREVEVVGAPKVAPTVRSETKPAAPMLEPAKPPPRVAVEPLKGITNSIGMKLVLIPAGEFLMGSPDSDEEALDRERPQHRVRITRAFYLGIYPVTQAQYREVTGSDPSDFVAGDNTAAEPVTWHDAIAFCNKLSEREGLRLYYNTAGLLSGEEGYRLPTEAEWEYACRARTTTRYSFGDDEEFLRDFGWYAGSWVPGVPDVGEKCPNTWGLYDMHGNVSEWCWDWYEDDYYQESPETDPLGPSQASERVVRGGASLWGPSAARSASRGGIAPHKRNKAVGFRVARSLPPP
jgi:formylglycine-generating enzyme required for sulfatase activity